MKNKFKQGLLVLFVLIVMITITSGCAAWKVKKDIAGGYMTTTSADYVVIVYSAGSIMDVYKINNGYVASEENSDGWQFVDADGNGRRVSGDVTIVRIKDGSLNDYAEYHAIDGIYRNKNGVEKDATDSK